MTNPAQKLWSASLGQLQLEVPRPSYETWLKGTMGLSIDGDLLSIGTPTTFASEWLGRRMHQVIEDVVSDVAGRPIRVAIKVVSPHFRSDPAENGATGAPIPAQPVGNPHPAPSVPARNYNGNSRYTFNNFITGVFQPSCLCRSPRRSRQTGCPIQSPLHLRRGRARQNPPSARHCLLRLPTGCHSPIRHDRAVHQRLRPVHPTAADGGLPRQVSQRRVPPA